MFFRGKKILTKFSVEYLKDFFYVNVNSFSDESICFSYADKNGKKIFQIAQYLGKNKKNHRENSNYFIKFFQVFLKRFFFRESSDWNRPAAILVCR